MPSDEVGSAGPHRGAGVNINLEIAQISRLMANAALRIIWVIAFEVFQTAYWRYGIAVIFSLDSCAWQMKYTPIKGKHYPLTLSNITSVLWSSFGVFQGACRRSEDAEMRPSFSWVIVDGDIQRSLQTNFKH